MMAEGPVSHDDWTAASEREKSSILRKEKQVEEILDELKHLDQSEGERTKLQVEQKEEQLYQLMGTSPDQWLPSGDCTTVISRCESYLSDIHVILTHEEQMTPSELLANASGGLALKGFFQGKLVEPKRKVLNPPENVTFKSTEMTLVDKTEEYLSKEQLDTFLQTLDKMGYSVAANAKVGLWGFGGEVTETPRCEQESRAETRPTEQCTFLSQINYTVVPVATCEIGKDELTLSPEALCEIQNLERSIRASDRIADVFKLCEEFFNTFGTHVKVGPLHFGGMSKTVGTYSSERMSQTSSVKSLLSKALSAPVSQDCAERVLDFVGHVDTGSSQARQEISKDDVDQSKVDIVHSRTGGLSEVAALSLWKSGLVIHNSTWALIDWGSDSVGIWDLLQNQNTGVYEPQILASTLKNVWQRLNHDISDVVFKVNELANMAERWLSDFRFSSECKLYLKEIIEVFHDVESESDRLQYWFSKHGPDSPLDRFFTKLVKTSDQLPQESLPLIQHWLRELIKPSPPDSIFRKTDLMKLAQPVQHNEENTSRDYIVTVPELVTYLEGQLSQTSQTENVSSQASDNINGMVAISVNSLLNSLSSPHDLLFLRTLLLGLEFDEDEMAFKTIITQEKMRSFIADTRKHWQVFKTHMEKGKTMEAEAFLIHLLLTSNVITNHIDQQLKESEFAKIIRGVRQVASVEVNQVLNKHATPPCNWDKLIANTQRLADGDLSCLEENPVRLPGLQNVLECSSPDTMTSQDIKKARRKKQKGKRKPKQMGEPYKDLLSKLGLTQYYPNQITLEQATEIRATPSTLKISDLPWKLIHMLMKLDNRARDHYLDEMSKEQTEDISFKLDLSEYDEEVGAMGLQLNPIDILLATFACCDGILQQVLAQNLFLCKLAIPLIYPVGTPDTLVFSLWALRPIIVQCRDASGGTVETPVTDQSFPVVTFVRLGNPPTSKSRLLNDILTGGSHDTFYSAECHEKTASRKMADGILEGSWFLPALKENDTFPTVTLFLNLRGDGSEYPRQMSLVNKLSSLTVVVANVESLAKHPNDRTFAKICKTAEKVVLLLTSKHESPDMRTVQRQWEACVSKIDQKYLTRIHQIPNFKKNMSAHSLKSKLQAAMPRLLQRSSNFSLEQIAILCGEAGIQIDEQSEKCRKGRQLAEEVMKEMRGKPIVECKRDLLPLQGKTWQEYSKLLKQQHRTGGQKEDSVSQHSIQTKMMKLREKQVQMCNNPTPFIASFVGTILSTNKGERTFFLQWMKLMLDVKSRENLPTLNKHYCQLWGELHKLRSSSDKGKVPKLRDSVRKAEQDIADASFGLENIFREVGQIYEAVHDSNLKVDKKTRESLKQLPQITAKLLLIGTPLELLDGDASSVPITWITAVLSELRSIIGDERLLVISVLGVQSSGKSTLLNTMFGLKFAVSAGRCTRGAFMQVIKVDRPDIPVRYVAVIDTEGLRAPELAERKHSHDNELATLAIGLGDITLINNKGENTAEVKDVLQIAVHAFMRMKIVNKNLRFNQECVFIHQNVPAINAKEKMAQSCQKLQEQLDVMTQEAAESENYKDINSFSQIIHFDINEHVWYFLDLWHGNPPMAPVNQAYSGSAETVKEHLLGRIANKPYLTLSTFGVRLQDLWNGILADDFVFSFRNTLELKAYSAMEEKYCGLRWDLDKSITNWIQQKAEIRIRKCDGVDELESVHQSMVGELSALFHTEATRMRKSLKDFFEKSDLQEIVIQWKQGKLNALNFDSDQCCIQAKKHLAGVKENQRIDLLGREKSEQFEATVMKKAIALAHRLKGKDISDTDRKKEFEKMWIPVVNELTPMQSTVDLKVAELMRDILQELFQKERHILNDELKKQDLSQPLKHGSLAKGRVQVDIEENCFSFSVLQRVAGFFGKNSVLDKARRKTSSATVTILAAIDEDLSKMCHEDIKFQKAHAEKIIRMLKDHIDDFNEKEAATDNFSVLPNFIVRLAVHVSRHCVKVFSQMQRDYEEAHGTASKLKAFREKAWKVFSHTIQQSTEEVLAADLFCDQLQGIVESTVTSAIPHRVVDEVIMDFSATKHHLIQTILDDLANKGEFENYMMYIKYSQTFASKWIREYIDEKFLTVEEGRSVTRYGELMADHVKRILRCVVKGTEHANSRMPQLSENQLHIWITYFCEAVDLIPVKRRDLKEFSERNIENFSHLQECILQQLEIMASTLIECYTKQKADAIKWESPTPYEQVLNKLWGCPAQCPFCGEPCSLTTLNHYDQTGRAHHCLQHRPSGVHGTSWAETSDFRSGELDVDTCNYSVQSRTLFNCAHHGQENEACSKREKEAIHHYTEYKTIFPDWDIAPEPTNTASKYWAWFMSTYRHQLAERYQAKLPSIPPAWNGITKHQALTDLRRFRH